MARVESVQLVDDLDGGAADETVSFSLEGSRWEIDLTAAHAAALRAVLAPFVGAARPSSDGAPGRTAPRPSSPRTSEATRGQTAEIRRWALANGFELSGRGRIPNAVVEAFDGRSGARTPAARADAPTPDHDGTPAPAPAPAAEPPKPGVAGPVDLSGLFKEASVR
ncbi:Lsr2 family protein [Pseudonocardia sp. KRD291]|uniref:histone-like nucleoid-structuring protein Lsr2 n=1 Tax=Pseudonocardia sp. KRD291 TaxID=2792007 RepID=UPI001C4A0208|nr:Lsr2 family protein [Pseudonocardia sp. KRD291]MBW0102278.1 Lsr2 family protein [Pseudonocardia sp. KRD291]